MLLRQLLLSLPALADSCSSNANYRVAITVVLDPIEGPTSDAAAHKALELVQNAMCNDTTAHHFPDELAEGIGNGKGGIDCMIRGAVPSEISEV